MRRPAYYVGMGHLVIRQAGLEDAGAAEHAHDLAPLLAGKFPGAMPAIVLLAHEPESGIVGFIEVGLRSHADGCNPSRPVGYIEGWHVAPAYRRRKVGSTLVAAAEEWVRNQGCNEIASDTWLDAFDSQRAHEALKFEVVDRCIHYRKHL